VLFQGHRVLRHLLKRSILLSWRCGTLFSGTRGSTGAHPFLRLRFCATIRRGCVEMLMRITRGTSSSVPAKACQQSTSLPSSTSANDSADECEQSHATRFSLGCSCTTACNNVVRSGYALSLQRCQNFIVWVSLKLRI
jgi:hypothetical protein